MADLSGIIVGTAAVNAFALLVTKSWPISVRKILVVSATVFLLLWLGDNALREQSMPTSAVRVGIAQGISTLFLVVAYLARSPAVPKA